jgi:hypothetical protein
MNRLSLTLLMPAAATLALMTGPAAAAKLTAFTATCPTGINVVAKKNGVVRINGKKATVTITNDNYYEAVRKNVTISVATDASGLIVSYTLKGGANGICTVAAESGDAGGSDLPPGDEKACLKAVRKQTNNPDVVTLDSETSEANNMVIVGVGPDRAPWKCLVKDGKVAEVTSETDEGEL